MEEFIPSATEADLGIGESLYHAEKVIDAFSRALSDNNCLSVIPTSIYTQAEDYIGRLEDAKESLGEEGDQRATEINESEARKGKDPETNSTSLVRDLANSVRNSLEDECFDCGWDDFPEFDFTDIFGNIFSDIEAFLDRLDKIGDLDASICHLAYLLSYTCVPDLIKILAMLLAYLLKLLAKIFLGSFSISMLVMAIIGALIQALLEVVLTMTRWALGPVQCYIDTLTSIFDLLPTKDNIKENLTAEQQRLLEKITAKQFEAEERNPRDGYFNQLGKGLDKDSEALVNKMKDSGTVAEKAAESIIASWGDITSLGDYMSCEDIRSGSGILDYAEDVMAVVSLCNLIRAVIEAKSIDSALDELCNPRSDSGIDPTTEGKPFTNDQIADVIESALGRQTEIVNSEDGDIAIIIKEDTNLQPNRLDLYSCSMNDFIKGSHLDQIIEESVVFAEDVLIGEGKDPRTNLRERTPLDDVQLEKGADILVFGETSSSYNQEIIDIIDDVVSFKRNKAETRAAADIGDLKLDPNVLPDAAINANSETVSGLGTSTLGPTNTAGVVGKVRGTGEVGSAISGNIVTKSLQLKCGTISNLEQSLSFID